MSSLTMQRAVLCGLALSSVIAFGACDRGGGQTGVRGIDKFTSAGPERVSTVRVGQCTRFLPPQGPDNSRMGLGWANGTGGTPNTYSGILTRVASFGTLVTAANTTNSGSGREVSQCINELAAARDDSNGRFATSGHSQGGTGCINASGLNNRVVVTCPVELDGVFTVRANPPDARDIRGSQNGPALIMCGGNDTLAPCGLAGNGDTQFGQARVPITRISVDGASHFTPTGGGGLFAALVTACVEAAAGDQEALAALSPGGANNGRGLSRVASRNF